MWWNEKFVDKEEAMKVGWGVTWGGVVGMDGVWRDGMGWDWMERDGMAWCGMGCLGFVGSMSLGLDQPRLPVSKLHRIR